MTGDEMAKDGLTGNMTGETPGGRPPAGGLSPDSTGGIQGNVQSPPGPVWDQQVRLPPLPSQEDMNLVYRHLMGLLRMNLRVEFPEKTMPIMRPVAESFFNVLQFMGPLKDFRGEPLNHYPVICYFIEDPFIVADNGVRLRKSVSVEELLFALRNPDDWNGFWETAIRGLKAWGENYEKLRAESRRVCQTWPEVPEDTLAGFWLSQMSMVWMRYGQCYFMIKKDDDFDTGGGSQFITRQMWDPIQSMGEWGAAYLRAWSTGFFDTVWYYRLKMGGPEQAPEQAAAMIQEMKTTMRIVKGRYLMLHGDETQYTVNPTYSEEYMSIC